MSQETITIKFEPKGDKELIQALNNLAKAQGRVTGKTNSYTKAQKKSNAQVKKANKGLLQTGHSARQTSGAFSVLRSKLLLFNFAMALGIRQISKFAQEAAKVESMGRAFTTLSGGGESASIAMDKLQKATDGTMSKFDLFQQANNAMILGVSKNSDEMAEMFDIAQRLGRALGRDTASSVESLITGIGRQSRLMLDNIGIIVKAEEAYEAYANELGITADKLTDTQRKQAFLNATMTSARQKVATLGDELPSTQDSYDRLSSATTDLTVATGQLLSDLLNLPKAAEQSAKSMRLLIQLMEQFSAKGLWELLKQNSENVFDVWMKTSEKAKMLQIGLDLWGVSLEGVEENIKVVNYEGETLADIWNDLGLLGETLGVATNTLADAQATLWKWYNKSNEAKLKGLQMDEARLLMYAAEHEVTEEMRIALEQIYIAMDKLSENTEENTGELKKNAEAWEFVSQQQKDFIINSAKLSKIYEEQGNFFQGAGAFLEGFGGAIDVSAFTSLAEAMKAVTLDPTSSEKSEELLEAQLATKEAFYLQMGNMTTEFISSELAKKEGQIRTDGKRELKALRNSREYQRASDKRKLEMEKEVADKRNKELKKNFRIQQAMSIAQVGMDTARAIMGIWAEVPKFDFGISAGAMTAMVGTLGAAQIAMITSQSAPKFAQGGMIGGNLHSQGGTMIEAERGEFIMSRNAVESVGLETMNQINQGGGTGNINVSFSGNVMSNDFIENEAIPQIKEAIRRGADIGIA